MNNIIVSICCLTYNHEKFIRKCLDGFLMQNCNFEFEILIHDDASLDGTADVIREYQKTHPGIIKPIIQTENQYSKGIPVSRTYNFSRATGKYIAMCEGDDYWTDPLKLQKQIDFLENNKEYTLTCGGFTIVNAETKVEQLVIKSGFVSNEEDHGFTFSLSDTKYGWLTKTMTSVFVNNRSILDKLQPYAYPRDIHLFYHLLSEGNGYYFKQAFGIYNVHSGGVFSSNKKSLQNYRDHYNIYKELFIHNQDDSHARYMYQKAIVAYIQSYLSAHQRSPDIKLSALVREGITVSTSIKDYISLCLALAPPSIRSHIKKVIRR